MCKKINYFHKSEHFFDFLEGARRTNAAAVYERLVVSDGAFEYSTRTRTLFEYIFEYSRLSALVLEESEKSTST